MVAMMPLHATTARFERSTLLPTLKKSGRPRDARGRFIRHHERLPVSPADTRGALFVVSEMADFIKAGGLGDVAAALPRALRHRYDVRVLIPGYRAVLARAGKVEIVGRVLAHAALPACDIGRIVQSDGLPIYILLSKELFERDGSPYVSTSGSEFEDNAIRFATLSHAAAQIAAGHAGLGWKPRLLHLNDWPCALAAAYVRWSGGTTPCLLTIHNLAYQGLVPYSMAAALGIPAERVAELEFYGQMSFLRGGIVHADHVNTVSVSYAQQITGPAQGCGLDRLLAGRAAKGALTGIVNGIDASWDPRTDEYLDTHFSVNQWQGRQANAAQVRKAFGLRESTGPLFAVVSRLVHQKGLDLICEVARRSWPPAADRGDRRRRAGDRAAGRRADPALSRPGGCLHWVRGRPGAAHVCRCRLPADAVALRAVRPEPDVRAALWLPADRARHRRPDRHGG